MVVHKLLREQVESRRSKCTNNDTMLFSIPNLMVSLADRISILFGRWKDGVPESLTILPPTGQGKPNRRRNCETRYFLKFSKGVT
jgi:hypothetical protein